MTICVGCFGYRYERLQTEETKVPEEKKRSDEIEQTGAPELKVQSVFLAMLCTALPPDYLDGAKDLADLIWR